MNQQMKTYSQTMEFEKALQLRNQITAIEHLHERQTMQQRHTYDEDLINYMIHDGTIYLMVFNVYKGTLSNKNEFVFEYHNEFFEEFLIQYYSDNPIPSEVIIPQKPSESLNVFLEQKRKKHVKILFPKKGPKNSYSISC